MKKLIISIALILTAGIALGQNANKPNLDSEIVGRWDYVKTVNPDGTEVFEMIGAEHYYADGTVLYLNMWLNPFSFESFPVSRDDLISAHKNTHSGLGTFEIIQKNHSLIITTEASSDTSWIGRSFEVKYEIIEDTIVFFDKLYFVRVKD